MCLLFQETKLDKTASNFPYLMLTKMLKPGKQGRPHSLLDCAQVFVPGRQDLSLLTNTTTIIITTTRDEEKKPFSTRALRPCGPFHPQGLEVAGLRSARSGRSTPGDDDHDDHDDERGDDDGDHLLHLPGHLVTVDIRLFWLDHKNS